jgi:hypothetical protein
MSPRIEIQLSRPAGGRDIALLMKLSPRELSRAARCLREKAVFPGSEKTPAKKHFFVSQADVNHLKELAGPESEAGPAYRLEPAPEGPKVIANFEDLPDEVKDRPAEGGDAAAPAALPAGDKGLLRKVAWILTFYRKMLAEVAAQQKSYFDHFDPRCLSPLGLPGLARTLGVSLSTVHRATRAIGNISYYGRPIPLASLVPGNHLQGFQAFYILSKMEWGEETSTLTGQEFARVFGGIARRTAAKYLHNYRNPLHPVHGWLLTRGIPAETK